MNKKSHIKADLLFLNYTLPEIHRLLDDVEAINRYGPKHRIVKHNEKTLEWIREMFGKKAFDVALLHILIDNDIIMDRDELIKYL